MKTFFEKTKHTGTSGLRDTSIYQASKYLERQQLKLKQIHRQITTMQAYRDELAEKEEFLREIKLNYPFIGFKEHEVHSYTFEEMKIKISQMLEHARFTGAAIKIQRLFRSKLDIIRYDFSMRESNAAARKIQLAWRRLHFRNAIFRLIQRRKDSGITIIQKYLRGYLSRRRTIQYFKDEKINGNL